MWTPRGMFTILLLKWKELLNVLIILWLIQWRSPLQIYIEGRSPANKLNRVLGMYYRYVGRRVYLDASTLISKQTSSDCNWTISYLLRNFGMISRDIKLTLDLDLQQCLAIVNYRVS